MSRVGGSAQIKAMRQVAGTLRLDLAQFRELAAFAQFGSSDLDKATQAQLNRGARLVEVLKQPQYQPLPAEVQVIVIYAATNGYFDAIPVPQVRTAEAELIKAMTTHHGTLLATIREKKTLDDALKGQLNETLKEFVASYTAMSGAKA